MKEALAPSHILNELIGHYLLYIKLRFLARCYPGKNELCKVKTSHRKQEKWNDNTDSKLILSAGSCVAVL